MRLDARDEDGQLTTLTAPPPSHSHPQGFVRLLLHSDVFFLAGDTLREVLTQKHTNMEIANLSSERKRELLKYSTDHLLI